MRRSPCPDRTGLAALAGWALVVPPAAVAAARLARREGTSTVLMAEALGPLLGLPALAALVLATVTRRRGLGAVSAGVMSLYLTWLAAELRQAEAVYDRGGDAPPADQWGRLRLLTANVLYTNTDLEGIAADVTDADPDVVILQEVTPRTVASLRRAGTLDEFPHQSLRPRTDHRGWAILSRLPLDDIEEWPVAGMLVARATVVVDDHRLRLYNVHTKAPFGRGSRSLWRNQLAALAGAVVDEDGPLVLAGDFNAGSGHRQFRALMAAGVRDAHMVCRRWWVTTWPSDMRLAPPFARIDHVLVSRRVQVLGVSEGAGRGSDHRPVIADLAVVG